MGDWNWSGKPATCILDTAICSAAKWLVWLISVHGRFSLSTHIVPVPPLISQAKPAR